MRAISFVMALVAASAAALPALADDAEITGQIVSQLRQQQNSGALKGFRIRVKCDEGTVHLQGRVSNTAQLEAALDVARTTKGVKLVVNDLEVISAEADAPLRQPKAILSHFGEAMTRTFDPVSDPSPADSDAAAAPRPVALTSLEPAKETSPAGAKAPRRINQVAGGQSPLAFASAKGSSLRTRRAVSAAQYTADGGSRPLAVPTGGITPARYDNPHMPPYAWPSYAAYPNYAGVTYPEQYSVTAWPFIGPFYPYPQVPLGWRRVTLEWDDGWWMLDFKSRRRW